VRGHQSKATIAPEEALPESNFSDFLSGVSKTGVIS
jgi:hypothetical protein